jgi:hypothetical protein
MMARNRSLAALLGLTLIIAGCQSAESEQSASGGTGDSSGEKAASAGGARTGIDRNACDLLTEAEVSAVAGVPVTARETNREEGRSDCGWFDAGNIIHMGLVGYWTGGPQGWEIMAASRGMAKDIIQSAEGVALDSVVQAGPVSGLGDKAFFSPLFPSLVLEGDVLLEFTLALLDKPEAHFRPLATKALGRL